VLSLLLALALLAKALYTRRVVARLTAAASVACAEEDVGAAAAARAAAAAFRFALQLEFTAHTATALVLLTHVVCRPERHCAAPSSGDGGDADLSAARCATAYFNAVHVAAALRWVRLQLPARLVVLPEAFRCVVATLFALGLVAARQPGALTPVLVASLALRAAATALLMPLAVALCHNRVFHMRHMPPGLASWPAAAAPAAAALAAAAERAAAALLPEPAMDAAAAAGLLAAYLALQVLHGSYSMRPIALHAARLNVVLLAATCASVVHKRRTGAGAALALLQKRLGRAAGGAPAFQAAPPARRGAGDASGSESTSTDEDVRAEDDPDAIDADASLTRRLMREPSEQQAVRAALAALHKRFPAARACALATLEGEEGSDGDADGKMGSGGNGGGFSGSARFRTRFLEVAAADDGERAALRAALSLVAAASPAAARSAARAVCAPGGPAVACSCDWAGGAAAFDDWRAAARGGLRAGAFLTARLPSIGGGASAAGGASAVGFLVLAFGDARAFGAADAAAHDALFAFASAAGAALGARRAADAAAAAARRLGRATALAAEQYPSHLLHALGARARRASASTASASARNSATADAAAAAEAVADAEAAAARGDSGAGGGGADAVADADEEESDLLMEHHDDVTVVVADVVGFSALCDALPPDASIRLLHRLWSRFDALAAAHALYKVETVGDSYVAVAGMLPARADHARAALRFALDLHAAASAVVVRPGWALSIRVGLHTGGVSSGVLGRVRPRFCVFGATVSGARASEAAAAAGAVQLSSATAAAAGLPPGALPTRTLPALHAGGATRAVMTLQAGSPEAAHVRALLDAPPESEYDDEDYDAEEEEEEEEEKGVLAFEEADEDADAVRILPIDDDDEGGPVAPPEAEAEPAALPPLPRFSVDAWRPTPRRSSVDYGSGGGRAPRSSRSSSPRRRSMQGGPRSSVAGGSSAPGSTAGSDEDGCGADARARARADAVRFLAFHLLFAGAPCACYLLLHARAAGYLGAVATTLAVAAAPLLLRTRRRRDALLPPACPPAALRAALWAFSALLNTTVVAATRVAAGGDPARMRDVFIATTLVPIFALPWIMAGMPIRLLWFPDLLQAAALAGSALQAAHAAGAAELLTSAAVATLLGEMIACTAVKLLLLPLLYVPHSVVIQLLADVDTCPPWAPLRAARDAGVAASLAARKRLMGDAPLLDAQGAATLTAHMLALLAPMVRAANGGFSAAGVARAVEAARGALLLVCAGRAAVALRTATLVARTDEHDAAAEGRALGALRARLAGARSEAAVLAAAAAALEALFPGAVGGAVGTFAEGTSCELVASLDVFAPSEAARAALAAALPSSVAAAPAAGSGAVASSVARVCRDAPGRAPLLDSRDLPGGLGGCADWSTAAAEGLPTARAITAPLSAGPVIVGFATLHFGLYATPHTGRIAGAALLRLCDVAGGAIFVRRAFAVSRDGAAAGVAAAPPPPPPPRRVMSATNLSRIAEQQTLLGGAAAHGAAAAAPAAAQQEPYPSTPADAAALAALDACAEADGATLRSWSLDAWALPDGEVQRLALAMLHGTGVLRAFRLSPCALAAFVADVAAHMNDCPFRARPFCCACVRARVLLRPFCMCMCPCVLLRALLCVQAAADARTHIHTHACAQTTSGTPGR
jgi:class 3 adenylate cyclase